MVEIKKKTLDTPQILNNRKAFEIMPFHPSYSVGHRMLFLAFVLSAASSLRGGILRLEVVKKFRGLSLEVPSWHCARLWLLRLGYDKLTGPNKQGTDWVWIVDHTIQLGCETSLVILGIRLCHLPPPGKSLKQEEIEAITLSPVTQSKGEIVDEPLEKRLAKTGVPRMMVGDDGSDLTAGIERFGKTHQQTSSIYDITHKTATLLKGELQPEEAWFDITRLASQTKK